MTELPATQPSEAVTPDRLTEIEGKLEWLCAYYDLPEKTSDAEDDVLWLIAEVKRLRTEQGVPHA